MNDIFLCQTEIEQGYCDECEKNIGPFELDEETRLALVEDMTAAMKIFDDMIDEINAEFELEKIGLAPWQLKAKPFGYFANEKGDELDDYWWGY